MTLWPEKISVEQYIEKIRKGLRFMGRLLYVIVLMLVVILILFVGLIFQGIHLLSVSITIPKHFLMLAIPRHPGKCQS